MWLSQPHTQHNSLSVAGSHRSGHYLHDTISGYGGPGRRPDARPKNPPNNSRRFEYKILERGRHHDILAHSSSILAAQLRRLSDTCNTGNRDFHEITHLEDGGGRQDHIQIVVSLADNTLSTTSGQAPRCIGGALACFIMTLDILRVILPLYMWPPRHLIALITRHFCGPLLFALRTCQLFLARIAFGSPTTTNRHTSLLLITFAFSCIYSAHLESWPLFEPLQPNTLVLLFL